MTLPSQTSNRSWARMRGYSDRELIVGLGIVAFSQAVDRLSSTVDSAMYRGHEITKEARPPDR